MDIMGNPADKKLTVNQFIKIIQEGVEANILESIDQFHGDELDGAKMTYDEWVTESTEHNGDPTHYCFGL